MKDKQIIINGCDVSGCDFYDKNKKYCLTLKMDTTGFKNPSCFSGDFQECIQDSKVCPNTFCDNNHNCYYKQIQQYKQCLDEIEAHIETCKNTMYCKDCKFYENCQYRNGWGWGDIVLQKIKQAKEGGENGMR